VNSRITLVKESARIKVDQLDSKCEEIEEEVCGHLFSFGSMCGLNFNTLFGFKISNCRHTS